MTRSCFAIVCLLTVFGSSPWVDRSTAAEPGHGGGVCDPTYDSVCPYVQNQCNDYLDRTYDGHLSSRSFTEAIDAAQANAAIQEDPSGIVEPFEFDEQQYNEYYGYGDTTESQVEATEDGDQEDYGYDFASGYDEQYDSEVYGDEIEVVEDEYANYWDDVEIAEPATADPTDSANVEEYDYDSYYDLYDSYYEEYDAEPKAEVTEESDAYQYDYDEYYFDEFGYSDEAAAEPAIENDFVDYWDSVGAEPADAVSEPDYWGENTAAAAEPAIVDQRQFSPEYDYDDYELYQYQYQYDFDADYGANDDPSANDSDFDNYWDSVSGELDHAEPPVVKENPAKGDVDLKPIYPLSKALLECIQPGAYPAKWAKNDDFVQVPPPPVVESPKITWDEYESWDCWEDECGMPPVAPAASPSSIAAIQSAVGLDRQAVLYVADVLDLCGEALQNASKSLTELAGERVGTNPTDSELSR